MSARDQVFTGTVTGDVAGRDVVKNIHLQPQRPESALQAAFKRDTGIHCNREVRELLETLMHDHNFTAPDLRRAWNTLSLVWNERNGSLKCASGAFQLVLGWSFVGCITLMYSTLLFVILGSHYGQLIQAALVALLTGCAIPALSHTVQQSIFSHYTAKRAAKHFERTLQ